MRPEGPTWIHAGPSDLSMMSKTITPNLTVVAIERRHFGPQNLPCKKNGARKRRYLIARTVRSWLRMLLMISEVRSIGRNHVGPSGLDTIFMTFTPTDGRGYYIAALRACALRASETAAPLPSVQKLRLLGLCLFSVIRH